MPFLSPEKAFPPLERALPVSEMEAENP